MTVTISQRYTRTSPCPVCGGYPSLPQGQGQRCHGFLSDDARFARCSREEQAGSLTPGGDGLYGHSLDRGCRCGVAHGSASQVVDDTGAPPAPVICTTRYEVRDADGVTVAVHVRRDRADRSKAMHWERPGGAVGLNGTPVASLPLYGIDRLAASPDGVPVVVTEGESAAGSLTARDFLAVGTVTGAASTPSDETLKSLDNRPVLLWPDNDDKGREHMSRIASRLAVLGHPDVRMVDWTDARAKGDAADFTGTDEELAELLDAAEPWEGGTTDDKPPALRWMTAAEISEYEPEHTEWIVENYVAAKSVTELEGKIKHGKTTFLAHMVSAIRTGEPFLGGGTQRGPVVWLTEERTPTFLSVLRRAGLEHDSNLHVLTFGGTRHLRWDEVMEQATAKAHEVGAVLIVIDTIPQWAGVTGDSENDAGEALRAMSPVHQAAESGLAVVVVRHGRKRAAEIGDSARGSSAWGGASDILLSLRRMEGQGHDSRRKLKAVGRFDDIPGELIIEIQDGKYVSLGDAQDAEQRQVHDALLDFLPATAEDAMPEGEILEELKQRGVGSRTSFQRARDVMLDEHRLRQAKGYGKTKRAFGYWLNDTPGNDVPVLERGLGS